MTSNFELQVSGLFIQKWLKITQTFKFQSFGDPEEPDGGSCKVMCSVCALLDGNEVPYLSNVGF